MDKIKLTYAIRNVTCAFKTKFLEIALVRQIACFASTRAVLIENRFCDRTRFAQVHKFPNVTLTARAACVDKNWGEEQP